MIEVNLDLGCSAIICERFAFKAIHYMCKHKHGTHIEYFKLRPTTMSIGVLLPNTQRYFSKPKLNCKNRMTEHL